MCGSWKRKPPLLPLTNQKKTSDEEVMRFEALAQIIKRICKIPYRRRCMKGIERNQVRTGISGKGEVPVRAYILICLPF